MQQLETDYLVIGSGAMGMAFCDSLITETNSNIIIVDKHHQPGGHWNDAYPFVRLHQPSAFYGVNSKKLGNNTIDATGLNKGLYELATNSEVCGYFDQVMQRQFLGSGRVRYFPSCEYYGDGQFVSLLSDEKYSVSFKKEVDSTYMNVMVPSKRSPPFSVEGCAKCAPLNDLPVLSQKYDDFVIVGAGKTAIDAVLFLLKNDLNPAKISWIMPRDSWILDRAQIQPTLESIGTALATQIIPGSQSDSIDDFFDKIAKAGGLLRIDENVKPEMYRCSTVTKAELEQLRRVKNIIRKGRVKSISDTEIILEHGSIATTLETLHIDCAGDGLARRPPTPIFKGQKITLQSVRTCQQVFSAGLLGYIEANYRDDEKKNKLCKPVPHPNSDIDFLKNNLADAENREQWAKEPRLKGWLQKSRLNFESHILNANPLIKTLSVLAKIPFLRLSNKADEAQQKATENIKRLLDTLES
ncbi:MAG: NAD(P)-binding protein [Candidatus Azotimanducaceae bacterium]